MNDTIVTIFLVVLVLLAGYSIGNLAVDLYIENKIRFLIHENTLRGDKRLFNRASIFTNVPN